MSGKRADQPAAEALDVANEVFQVGEIARAPVPLGADGVQRQKAAPGTRRLRPGGCISPVRRRQHQAVMLLAQSLQT